MRQSLPGLAKTTRIALETSRNDLACMAAYSVCELIDNLRKVKDGDATFDEFFAVYVFDSKTDNLAAGVKRERYYCMRDEPDEDDEDAA